MLPAGREAGLGEGAPGHVRHCPELTLLYQVVDADYLTFGQYLQAQGFLNPTPGCLPTPAELRRGDIENLVCGDAAPHICKGEPGKGVKAMRPWLRLLPWMLLVFAPVGLSGDLLVRVDPPTEGDATVSSPRVAVHVRDVRAAGQRVSTRTAAFGVPMGNIRFQPGEVTLASQALQVALAGILRARGVADDSYYVAELVEFRVHTDTTALYWDVVGKVRVRLQLAGTVVESAGTATERTYTWPGEALVRRVVQQSLGILTDDLRTAADAMPGGALSGTLTADAYARLESATALPADTTAGARGESVPAGKAVIHLYRPERFAGSANAYRISLDGEFVGRLNVGDDLRLLVDPGTVNISAETEPNLLNIGLGLALMGRPTLPIGVDAGQAYYIDVNVDMAGGPSLVPVDAVIGRAGIDALGGGPAAPVEPPAGAPDDPNDPYLY